jgi:ribokinase
MTHEASAERRLIDGYDTFLDVFDLITAGEAFDDLVFFNLTSMPAAGRELKTDALARTAGGGAVTSGVAAARAGARVRIVAGLSAAAARALRLDAVSIVNLRRPGESAALTVALSTRRDRRFVTFNGMNPQLPARILALVPRLRARHVHFALHPGRCALWLGALDRLHRAGTTTSWAFGWNPDLRRDRDFDRLVDGLDYLFANRDEARAYGCRPSRGMAVITLGAAGARAIGDGVDLRVPSPRVRAVDTTGAGDVFAGAFLAARLSGAPLERALRRATRAAAASTRRPGGLA